MKWLKNLRQKITGADPYIESLIAWVVIALVIFVLGVVVLVKVGG